LSEPVESISPKVNGPELEINPYPVVLIIPVAEADVGIELIS
jgi:hypothetical protein